ncbi:hypothetical protein LOAG_07643 [Loa loa]|uniref:MITF_TFEB_C_3_N domain-containing protein n=1 Tax=Loa loa TaxID=7209 RepID=A0A1I7VKN2_LOALO|nr:hypothetical protein LOAG_07643 [Loa loa]EFO20847.1 hypothetical protein LOAG_07643 [Loa loa]
MVPPPVQEQQKQEKAIQLKTRLENRPSEDIKSEKSSKKAVLLHAEKEISGLASTIQKPERQLSVESETAATMESEMKLSQQVQKQKEKSNISKGQQNGKRDAATQVDMEAGKGLQKLSGFTTVLFGPYPLIRGGMQSVKCVQVGEGHIQQVK